MKITNRYNGSNHKEAINLQKSFVRDLQDKRCEVPCYGRK